MDKDFRHAQRLHALGWAAVRAWEEDRPEEEPFRSSFMFETGFIGLIWKAFPETKMAVFCVRQSLDTKVVHMTCFPQLGQWAITSQGVVPLEDLSHQARKDAWELGVLPPDIEGVVSMENHPNEASVNFTLGQFQGRGCEVIRALLAHETANDLDQSTQRVCMSNPRPRV